MTPDGKAWGESPWAVPNSVIAPPGVMRAMEKIRNSERESRCAGFNRSERRVIVDDIVCEYRFVPATPPKIQCREIVEGARGAYGGKEQIVFAVPKAVFEPRLGDAGVRIFVIDGRS